MDKTSTKQQLREQTQQQHLNHSTPILSLRRYPNPNPFSIFIFWVSKSLKSLCFRVQISQGFCLKRIQFNGMVVINTTLIYAEGKVDSTTMEGLSLSEKKKKKNEDNVGGCKRETFADLIEEKGCESSSSCSEFLSSENNGNEEHSQSSTEDSSSSPSLTWSVKEISASDCISPLGSEDGKKKIHLVDKGFEKQVSALSGIQCLFYAHNFI